MEYASKAVGTAGLTTGIIGTALGALGGGASMLLNNSIGKSGNASTCSEDHYVTRYELDMQNRLMEKDREIAILTSEQNTEIKIADVFEKIMTRVNQNQRDQADWNAAQSVANAQMSAAIATNANSIASLQNCCNQITKLVVPNTAVCPGWGAVTVSPSGGTTVGTSTIG